MVTVLRTQPAPAATSEAVSTGEPHSRPAELPRLVSLRGVFAILVFLIHADQETPIPGLDAVTHQAYIGVDFFFVLSGFVLVWADRRGKAGTRAGVGPFLRKRFARIWPLHLLTLAIAFVGAATSPTPATLEAIVLSVFLLQAWSPAAEVHYGLNGSAWSLSDEAFFYALFPLLRNRLGRPARVLTLCLLAVVVVAGLDLALPSAFARAYLYVVPVSHLAEFVIGMVLAQALAAGRLPQLPLCVVGPATVLSYALISQLGNGYRSAVGCLMLPALIALVVAGAQADLAGRGGFLQAAPMVLLGRISFAFYLIHQLVIKETHAAHLLPRDTIVSGYLYVLATLSVSLVAAWLLHTFVEQPVYKRLAPR